MMENFLSFGIPIATSIGIVGGVIAIEVAHWRKIKPMADRRADSIAIVGDIRTNNDARELKNKFTSLFNDFREQGITLHTNLEGCTEHGKQ